MTLSPTMRAVGAMLATAVVLALPLAVGSLLHADWALALVHARTPIYVLWGISFVASYGAFLWVRGRYSAQLSEPQRPALVAEMSLVAERLPKAAWLAVGPPILVAAALWWITAHYSELTWRYGWDGPPESGPVYRRMMTHAVLASAVSTFFVACSFAAWFGMSRVYQFRRALLVNSVLAQWFALAWIIDKMFWDAFRVPLAAAVISRTATAMCVCILFWTSVRLGRLYETNPDTGSGFYMDSRDPAYQGPRGLNLASMWFLGLAGSALVLLALAVRMLRWSNIPG